METTTIWYYILPLQSLSTSTITTYIIHHPTSTILNSRDGRRRNLGMVAAQLRCYDHGPNRTRCSHWDAFFSQLEMHPLAQSWVPRSGRWCGTRWISTTWSRLASSLQLKRENDLGNSNSLPIWGSLKEHLGCNQGYRDCNQGVTNSHTTWSGTSRHSHTVNSLQALDLGGLNAARKSKPMGTRVVIRAWSSCGWNWNHIIFIAVRY